MSFEAIALSYLNALQAQFREARRAGQHTPELSYRPTLNQFFKDVAQLIDPCVAVVYEPKKQSKAGHPDWRFHNAKNLGVYGYVEAKPLEPDRSIDLGNFEEQVERYFELGHRLVVTDGVEFCFFEPPNQEPARVLLIDKPVVVDGDWGSLRPNPLLETKLHQFFEIPAARKCSEEELVRNAAKIARELARNVAELSELPVGAGLSQLENQTIEVLRKLKKIVENHHDPRLRDRKSFSDFVAQVLIFGLLYSHRIIEAPNLSPDERYRRMQNFWQDVLYKEFTEQLRPFRALVELLKGELAPESLGPLGTWYQDCCLLFAHVQLDQTQKETPDYHSLYERFLANYDPETRFDFGAFYTPKELAKFSVRLTQAIVDCELHGFSLYAEGNKLIDPCCGTGTFLEQLILASEHSDLPKMIGFEILPAPYALAHYRLAMLRQKQTYPQNMSIVLTNTLSDELEQETQETEPLSLVEKEQAIARELAKPPLTLVIGNPPSSDSSVQSPKENITIVEHLVEDFRPPKSVRSNRQNIQKQLQNEFIRFLRWACNKLLLKPPGIFTLVLPSSFAEHSSYFYARKWLTSHFSELWVLDIDRDARTGADAASLFNTLQGRLLLIGFTGMDSGQTGVCEVKYGSIAHLTKEEKLRELSLDRTSAGYLEIFAPLPIDQQTCIFRPLKGFDAKSYSAFWPLYPEGKKPKVGEGFIFERHCSGVKLAPSSIFVHVTGPLLLHKLRDIADLGLSVRQIKARWFSEQSRPPSDSKLSESIRQKIGETLQRDGDQVVSYAYRPFTVVSALISESLLRELADVGGGGTRYRPEVLSAFQSKETFGIAIAPAPKDIGENLHRFASFCWYLPDNDLCRRGNAHVFCNRFPEYKEGDDWNSEPVCNINPELMKALALIVDTTPEEIVFYVYGILCSDSFMDKYEGALFTVADAERRPRIPFPKVGEIFKSIATKGKNLAELERKSSDSQMTQEFAIFEALFTSPFLLSSYKIDEESERIELYEDGKIIISVDHVPREILRFTISGYRVIQQWLKLYSYCYKRAEFTKEDYHELLRLLCRISEQIKTVKELDRDVNELLSGRVELLRCP